MERIKERTGQYEVSVRVKSNGYFEARVSFKLGGGRSPRLQKGGKSEELAVLNLLTALDSYIDTCYQSGIITTKIDDCIPQRLMKSINDLGVITSEITAKTLAIVNKINSINSNILNTIAVPNNVVPFYPPQNNTSNVVAPAPALVPTNINYNLANTNVPKKEQELCIIEDFATEWLKFRYSLCKKTDDNPKPLAPKTIDKNHYNLKKNILPFFKEQKILYLSQITEKTIEDLLKSIKTQHNKHKSHIVLNMMFKYAIQQKKAKYNPVVNVEKPPEKIATDEIKDEEDDNYIDTNRQEIWINKFEQETKETEKGIIHTDMAILFEVMLLTGIRPEEACGLQWKSVDFEKGVLLIKNAYKSINDYDENMEKIGLIRTDGTLKTENSYRKVPLSLSPRLKQLLLEHKEKQQAIFKKSRAIKDKHRVWSEDEYVFLGRNYHPYVSESLAHGLQKIRDKYKLEHVTPYGLRKSFASYWAEKGMKDTVLQAIMGHRRLCNYKTILYKSITKTDGTRNTKFNKSKLIKKNLYKSIYKFFFYYGFPNFILQIRIEEIIDNGEPGGVRTPDPRLRRPVLYPTELLTHVLGFFPTKVGVNWGNAVILDNWLNWLSLTYSSVQDI